MNILFIGGSSEIAIKVAKNIKKNVYSISRKNSIRYYKKNIQIKNYSENKLNFAFGKLKSINFQSVFIFNGCHKTSLLSFFNESLFDKMMETNLKIPIKITNVLIKNCHINKNGSINFIGSIAASKNDVGNAYYAISKLALTFASKLFMKEQKKRSIRFNTLSFGLVHTNIALNLIKKLPLNSKKKMKFTTIKKIADKIIFISKSKSLNGKNIII